MEAWGMTDTGLVRHENQDAFAIRSMESDGYTIAVVCDGMGGPGGGKLASTLAIDVFLKRCGKALRGGMTAHEIQRAVESAVAAANDAVYRRSREKRLKGMGTTLVSAIAWSGQALITNVGDSRAYFIHRSGDSQGLRQISRDHSYVNHLLERGDITEAEAKVHPYRNVITRALGPEPDVLCDSFLVELEAGDVLLLCTDGLMATEKDGEIESAVMEEPDGGACVKRLIALALSRGAPDNVTAVLLYQ